MKEKVIIIAEAGVNHNGDINLAKELIEIASDARADFVKFQTFKANQLVSPNAHKAKYQLQDNDDNKQLKMLQLLELSKNDHYILKSHSEYCGIKFLSSAFDPAGLSFLDELGLEFMKCPSGEITNYPYLRAIAKIGKPIILSTGMATIEEVEEALIVLEKFYLMRNNVTVLHCNTAYPTPYEDVNLNAMLTIQERLKVKIGYSDHSPGIEVPIAAVALGAMVIEKHFTKSKLLPGPDHKASLEPAELDSMVRSIRNVELAMLGDGLKRVTDSEKINITSARKSLHASKDLKKGKVITEDDLIPLRPANGISPMLWEDVLNKILKVDKLKFDQINWNDLN